MSVFIPEEENIYFPKTREYFKEVISSYSNGNYRSAIVMLYSVVICDMLFKLKELKDMYNDTVASNLLAFYEEKAKGSKKGSKSVWEKEFVDKIHNETELIDLEAYTHLNHLYDDRNFSAHPSLDRDFELISPSKETTLSHIKNALNDILIKPPLFLKNVVDTLTDDLDNKRDIFTGNNKDLKVYLENRYFSRMLNPMRIKVFKAFWKFVFLLPDDEKCEKNRNINRHVLEYLVKNSKDDFFEPLKSNDYNLDVDNDIKCAIQLVTFLANCPQMFKYLNDTTKLQLNAAYKQKSWLNCICWYEFESFKKHLDYLYKNVDDIPAIDGLVHFMVDNYKEAGMFSELLNYFIYCFGNSTNFDNANWNYQYTIKPFLNDFSKEQYIAIFEKINNNFQLYNRNLARNDNTEIYKNGVELYGETFDMGIYNHLYYDYDKTTKTEFEEIDDDDDDLPF